MKNIDLGTATKRAFAGDLATEEAQRVILNASIKTHAAAFGGYIADIGPAANLQDPTNATYFQADGAHLQAQDTR